MLSDDSDAEKESNDDNPSDDSDDNDDHGKPSHWDGVSLEEMMGDVASDPLPPPGHSLTEVQKVKSVIQWLCFFLIYWQLACHISDNGLEWLLRFFYQFLSIINCNIGSPFLHELLAIFPTSVYLLRKLISLDRDNFTKYVVCPRCHKLYNMNECTKTNGRGEIVSVQCSNRTLAKNGTVLCGSKLVKEVIVKNGSSTSKMFYPLKVYCYNSINVL